MNTNNTPVYSLFFSTFPAFDAQDVVGSVDSDISCNVADLKVPRQRLS